MQEYEDTRSKAARTDAIDDAIRLVARHPYLPMANVSYNRNFIDVLARAQAVADDHEKWLGDFDTYHSDGLSATYSDTNDAHYDTEKVAALKVELEKRAARISAFLPTPLLGLESDVAEIIAACKERQTAVKRALSAFLSLSPFLYSADGAPVLQTAAHLNEKIRSTSPHEIQALYADLFAEHLAPICIRASNRKGLGELHSATNSVVNHFINKTVRQATLLYASDHTTHKRREVSIETIPRRFSALRGSLAGDCSMASIPYYGLHKDTTVFWIRKTCDLGSKPVGYAFSVRLEKDGAPFVPTINGPTLSTTDTTHVLQLIASYYASDSVYVPDLTKSRALVNSSQVAEAFNAAPGPPANLTMPQGWEEIQNVSRAHQSYENYYHVDNLRQGKRVLASDLDTHVLSHRSVPRELRYPHNTEEHLDSISRSVIGYYASRCHQTDLAARVTERLAISPSNLIAVKHLIEVHSRGQMSLFAFKELNREFGMGAETLLALDVQLRAPILRPIHDEYEASYPTKTWADLAVRTNRELNELINAASHTNELDRLKDLKASMPDLYLPSYWEELLPHFFLRDAQEPDWYITNRFVKHFHSVGTIDAFLDFLMRYPTLRASIEGNNPRWVAFFDRANEFFGEQERFSSILQDIYLERPAARRLRQSARELAETFAAYRRWKPLEPEEFALAVGCEDIEVKKLLDEVAARESP